MPHVDSLTSKETQKTQSSRNASQENESPEDVQIKKLFPHTYLHLFVIVVTFTVVWVGAIFMSLRSSIQETQAVVSNSALLDFISKSPCHHDQVGLRLSQGLRIVREDLGKFEWNCTQVARDADVVRDQKKVFSK
jgi:hypothetical protein